MTNADDLLNQLQTIVVRFPQRAKTDYHADILAKLREWRAANNGHASHFVETWNALKEKLLCTPQYFYFVFRNVAENESGMLDLIKRQYFERSAAEITSFYNTDTSWIAKQANDADPESMVSQVLQYLAQEDYKKGKIYEYLSIYFTFLDLMHSHFVQPETKPTQDAIYDLLFLQSLNWPKAYCAGTAYQGTRRLSIGGGKPNEVRMKAYEIDSLLDKNHRVLDIGSNMGFMSLYFAERCKHVDALEYNPYLCQIGQLAANTLSIDNVSFLCGDFFVFKPEHTYDIVLSFASHATIDKRMLISFEDYIRKIYALLNPGGYLLFESHNAFGPGRGGPGDDGDLDAKFDIAAPYFEVIKHKMTWNPIPNDIDKLFILMKKRDSVDYDAKRTFKLAEAIKKYEY
jgi:SAM-dependent methyltransferase